VEEWEREKIVDGVVEEIESGVLGKGVEDKREEE